MLSPPKSQKHLFDAPVLRWKLDFFEMFLQYFEFQEWINVQSIWTLSLMKHNDRLMLRQIWAWKDPQRVFYVPVLRWNRDFLKGLQHFNFHEWIDVQSISVSKDVNWLRMRQIELPNSQKHLFDVQVCT